MSAISSKKSRRESCSSDSTTTEDDPWDVFTNSSDCGEDDDSENTAPHPGVGPGNDNSRQPLFPRSFDDADAIDKVLAVELEKLSLEEKERISFDVHGMAHEGTDPENIDSLLRQLELEICTTPDKKAYERAKYLNEEYVTDQAFRLMFLRCDHFDVKVTARRIVKHFEAKQKLFGDGAILGRDVLMSDLSEDDMKVLETGFWQFLPVRDAAGRLVIFHSSGVQPVEALIDDTVIRVMFYLQCVASRCEDVQKKGMVLVSWWNAISFEPAVGFNFLRSKLPMIRQGLPEKVSCNHFLIAKAIYRPVVSTICWFNRDDMGRTRSHYGSLEEMKFELQTFGIPTEYIPIFSSKGGMDDLANHKQWIVSQRKREEAEGQQAEIIVPGRFDVLFGRSTTTRVHPGNLRAAHMVEMFRDKYEAAGKYQKTTIAERIVDLIGESHGRFLKWEDDVWVEVNRQAARNKISHLFRYGRSKARTAPKEVSPQGSSNQESDGEARMTKQAQSETETPPGQKRLQRAS